MASASDDFNRADGALGANWSDASAGIVVSGNRAYQGTFTTHAISYYTGVLWSSDHRSQITVTDGDNFHGVGVRVTATQGYFFLGGDGTNAALFEMTAGVLNEVQAFPCTFANGDQIALSVVGSVLTLTQNGATRYVATRTAVPSGGSPGIHLYDGTATLDDWIGSDVGAATLLPRRAIGRPSRRQMQAFRGRR